MPGKLLLLPRIMGADSVGVRGIVPASFTAGRRYFVMNHQDAMAVCRAYGTPDLFVTFTCNPKCKEVEHTLRFEPGQLPSDPPDLIIRGFHMKIDELMSGIREGKTFGPIRAVLYTVSSRSVVCRTYTAWHRWPLMKTNTTDEDTPPDAGVGSSASKDE